MKKFVEGGEPRHLFLPHPGPALDGSGRKTTTRVSDHEYFIPTKFHQNPSSGSGQSVENVKVYGRTDDGRCAMTKAHLSLRPRWAKTLLWNFISNCVLFEHLFYTVFYPHFLKLGTQFVMYYKLRCNSTQFVIYYKLRNYYKLQRNNAGFVFFFS